MIPSGDENKDVIQELLIQFVVNANFDQAIIETSNGKDFWIHVSCQKNIKNNRRQVIRNLVKPALSKVEGK